MGQISETKILEAEFPKYPQKKSTKANN